MSGGYFDYECFPISHFADKLKLEIAKNKDVDEWGYSRNYSDETIALLSIFQRIIELAGNLAYETEWLYSDDIGEDSLVNRCNEHLMKSGLQIKQLCPIKRKKVKNESNNKNETTQGSIDSGKQDNPKEIAPANPTVS